MISIKPTALSLYEFPSAFSPFLYTSTGPTFIPSCPLFSLDSSGGVSVARYATNELEAKVRAGDAFYAQELNMCFQGVRRFASSVVPGHNGVEFIVGNDGSLYAESFETDTHFSLPDDGIEREVISYLDLFPQAASRLFPVRTFNALPQHEALVVAMEVYLRSFSDRSVEALR